MCGRYSLATPWQRLAEKFGIRIQDVPELFAERWNIAPSQSVLSVGPDRGGMPAAAFFRWGLVPSWSADAKKAPINARAETAATKPTFADALSRRRSLIPADGFYEWQVRGGAKQPWHFRMKDGSPFAFAGIWEFWRSHEGAKPLLTCAMLTVPANEVVDPVHARMPAILRPEDYAAWCDRGRTDAAAALRLVAPYPASEMEAVPVAAYVNDPRHEGADCLAPMPA
jgi:putative SOS response-associated peptidase YedK